MIYDLRQAGSLLSQLVERAARGEEVFLAVAGRPVAKLVAVKKPRPTRRPGGWEGQVLISEDFDAPLPDDLQAAFGRRSSS